MEISEAAKLVQDVYAVQPATGARSNEQRETVGQGSADRLRRAAREASSNQGRSRRKTASASNEAPVAARGPNVGNRIDIIA